MFMVEIERATDEEESKRKKEGGGCIERGKLYEIEGMFVVRVNCTLDATTLHLSDTSICSLLVRLSWYTSSVNWWTVHFFLDMSFAIYLQYSIDIDPNKNWKTSEIVSLSLYLMAVNKLENKSILSLANYLW